MRTGGERSSNGDHGERVGETKMEDYTIDLLTLCCVTSTKIKSKSCAGFSFNELLQVGVGVV